MIGACTVYCGCPITEEEVEELQYKCGDDAAHKPEEGSHPKRGRDESKHSEVFLVERRIRRERDRESMIIGKVSILESHVVTALNGGQQLYQLH